jgi:superfamily II DNA helicase RecQ
MVPFVVLTQDLLQQAQQLGIPATRWLGFGRPPQAATRMAQLVLVSAESCYSDSFVGSTQELAGSQRLAALFFDECHVCVTQDFRPAMPKM